MGRLRLYDGDPHIDQLEEEWWNQNANTVESIWALPMVLRKPVRRHYLEKATAFFLNNTEERPAKLIEIGCGSGWVGRLMAVRGQLHVIGIDLSTAQIGLARKNAIADGFAEICQYEVGNLASLSLAGCRESHCVMIHAILHHLTWREIFTVLEQISALGKGASVFVYEPVRLTSPGGEKSLAFKIARRLGRYAVIHLPRFSSWLLCNWGGKRDDALGQKLELLNRLARENGWELSPKEIVFSEEELVGILSKYFEIKEVRVCNYLSIIIGQQAGLYRSQFVSTIFANVLLPIARVVDGLLFKIGALPFLVDSHVFLGYSCRVK